MLALLKKMIGGNGRHTTTDQVKREGTDLGATAVAMGMITRAQAETARAHQQTHCPDKRMGDVFVERGDLTPDQLIAVVAHQGQLRDHDPRSALSAALDTAELHVRNFTPSQPTAVKGRS